VNLVCVFVDSKMSSLALLSYLIIPKAYNIIPTRKLDSGRLVTENKRLE
jgi:hypothetical protein